MKKVFPNDDKTYTYISEPVETPKKYTDEKNQYDSSGYQRKNKNYPNYKNQRHFKYPEKVNEILTPPSSPLQLDQASVEDLISMGFSKKVAYNIQKYVASGGKIYSPQQLLKIYGMDSVQLTKASPYIIFSSQAVKANLVSTFKKEHTNNTIIDLNTASTDDLESLNGIGTVLAERIVKFRESLGGFISPEQLKDCYGITPETFEQIKTYIHANGNPNLIAINEANLSTMVHPYLSRKLARIVQAYRDHHGPFINVEELRSVYPADSTWCDKLLPYLSFEIEEAGN
ncbi:MAG: helix-hairpin-helix domain-containing protein [Saprospiraceae bacterium]